MTTGLALAIVIGERRELPCLASTFCIQKMMPFWTPFCMKLLMLLLGRAEILMVKSGETRHWKLDATEKGVGT
jgi:hypothetical protein